MLTRPVRPCNVVVADCGLLDTLAADGRLALLQPLTAGAAYDIYELPVLNLPLDYGGRH